MKRQQVINCMFSSWYPNFRQISFKSKVLKLPKDFLDYLNQDGVVLPTDEQDTGVLSCDQGDDPEWNDRTDDDDNTIPAPSFPNFYQEIKAAIEELGGVVFPKLNWSSPRDASWISIDGTLKCSTFNDICLLLKSSNFITHDLTRAFTLCVDSTENLPDEHFVLVLRRWVDIIPGMEFRCFVKSQNLVAISQRDTATFYDYLEPSKYDVQNDIVNFFVKNLQGRFPDQDYVFDVYRYAKGKVKLIDFNPFSTCTDSLLFSWDELHIAGKDNGVNQDGALLDPEEVDAVTDDGCEIRVIERTEGIQPSPFLQYRMPKDILDLSSGEDINKLVDFLNSHDLIGKEN